MLVPVLVTPPDVSDPVVTLEEAKEQVRVTHADHDTYIAGLVAAAVAHLDGRTGVLGRCLVTQTWKLPAPCWEPVIRLPFPACSSVLVRYSDIVDAEQVVSSSLYEVFEDEISTLVRFRNAFSSPSLFDDRVDPVRITFEAGYGDAAAVPASIKHAMLLTIGHWYENREEVIIGQVDLRRLPMAFETLIAPYRCVPF